MKCWEFECPYNSSEPVSNLKGVSSWKKAIKIRQITQWKPPPPRTWKWNVDESAKGKHAQLAMEGFCTKNHGMNMKY